MSEHPTTTRESLAKELETAGRFTGQRAYDFVDRCIRLGLAKAVEELTSDGGRKCALK